MVLDTMLLLRGPVPGLQRGPELGLLRILPGLLCGPREETLGLKLLDMVSAVGALLLLEDYCCEEAEPVRCSSE
jgi:hypothetical protein